MPYNHSKKEFEYNIDHVIKSRSGNEVENFNNEIIIFK